MKSPLNAACVLMLAALAGCSEASKPAPLAPSCTYAVTVASSVFGGGGGTSEASVKAPAGCAWTAVSRGDWITISSGASGTSDGTVKFAVSPFEGAEVRAAALVIAEQAFTVTQNVCDARLKQGELSFADTGGQADIDIEADAGCRWKVEAGAPWVAVAPASGVGPGRATVQVGENPETEREAVLRVNARPVTIRQGAEPCGFDVSVEPASFPAGGGRGVLRVRARRGCAWQAEAVRAAWLTFPGSSSGSGAGEVPILVAASAEAVDRRATVRVGNSSAEVVQQGTHCEYRVQPVDAFVHSRGGSGSVTVTTAPGCAWTATNPDPFVRLSGDGPRTGPGSIAYEVAANPPGYTTDFRKSTIEVRWDAPTRGQNVLLRQFGNCATLLLGTQPGGGFGVITDVSFDASGGRKFIQTQVESAFTCPWTVFGSNDWVSSACAWGPGVPEDRPFICRGDGGVQIIVSPNPSPQPRSMILQIGERPLTVNQAGR